MKLEAREYERWAELVATSAREGLDEGEVGVREAIESREPALREEEGLWSAFAELDRPHRDERSDDDLLAALFDESSAPLAASLDDDDDEDDQDIAAMFERARLRGDADVAEPTSREGGLRAALAVGVAAAACVLLALGVTALRRGQATQGIAGGGTNAAMTLDRARKAEWAHPGERHELGRDECRRVAEGMRFCSPEAARVRIDEGSSRDAVQLELERGAIELDGLAANATVAVETPVGRVEADGGRFRLVFDERLGHLQIDVLAGEVVVHGNDGEPIRLGPGARWDLQSDDVVADARPRGIPVEREAVLADEAPPVDAVESTPKEPADKGASKPKPASERPAADGPDALLGAAQRALVDGDRRGAIELYRDLIARHGDTEAGRTARVSLGRLLLGSGKHEAALEEFDAYLGGAGGRHALLEEARYGRIRCLRALDRDVDLRDAIQAFQREHPSSIHSSRLGDWLAEVDSAP